MQRGTGRLLGQFRERGPVMGQQRLVRRHDRLARRQRRLHRSFRNAVRSADQFEKDVDPVVFRQRDRIIEPAQTRSIDPPIFRPVPRDDGIHLQRTTGPRRDPRILVHQIPERCRSDRSKTRNTELEGFFAGHGVVLSKGAFSRCNPAA